MRLECPSCKRTVTPLKPYSNYYRCECGCEFEIIKKGTESD